MATPPTGTRRGEHANPATLEQWLTGAWERPRSTAQARRCVMTEKMRPTGRSEGQNPEEQSCDEV